MKASQKPTARELRDTLLRNGLTLAAFARLHGFGVTTVREVVRRHYGCKVSDVRGVVTRAILEKLDAVASQRSDDLNSVKNPR